MYLLITQVAKYLIQVKNENRVINAHKNRQMAEQLTTETLIIRTTQRVDSPARWVLYLPNNMTSPHLTTSNRNDCWSSHSGLVSYLCECT